MTEEFLNLIPENITEYPNVILRQTGQPLEAFTIFPSEKLAQEYITTDLAYLGQQIAIYDDSDKKYKYYIVQSDDKNNKTLDPVADLSSLAKVAKSGLYEDLIGAPDVNNGTLTLKASDGVTATTEIFSANDASNIEFEVKHAEPTGASAGLKSGGKITSITTDKFGHVIAVGKGTDENSAHTHAAGTGITLDGDGGISGTTTISHADTSTLKEGNYGPSAGGAQAAKGTLKINVPQITVDGMGHVTNVVNKEFTVTDTDTASTVKSGDVLSLSDTNELSTNYSIKTTATVGNLASGTTVNGTIKELLDLVFGTPTKITNLVLTASNSSAHEYGNPFSLTKAVVTVQKGTANSLDAIEIRSGSATGTLLASTTLVTEGANTINIAAQSITANTTIYAVLKYDSNNTKTATGTYSFYYATYYGKVAASTSVDNITYTDLTKKNSKSGLKVTMSNECAVLAIPGTASTIKDENNFDCTGNFTKTTKTITNSYGESTSYTVFKLITPVSGTKTYTVS